MEPNGDSDRRIIRVLHSTSTINTLQNALPLAEILAFGSGKLLVPNEMREVVRPNADKINPAAVAMLRVPLCLDKIDTWLTSWNMIPHRCTLSRDFLLYAVERDALQLL